MGRVVQVSPLWERIPVIFRTSPLSATRALNIFWTRPCFLKVIKPYSNESHVMRLYLQHILAFSLEKGRLIFTCEWLEPTPSIDWPNSRRKAMCMGKQSWTERKRRRFFLRVWAKKVPNIWKRNILWMRLSLPPVTQWAKKRIVYQRTSLGRCRRCAS